MTKNMEGAMATGAAILLRRFYYFVFAVIIAVLVIAGFAPRLDEHLLHSPIALPSILYVHAAVFMGWIILFMVQSALIAAEHVNLHRKVGVLGFVLGVTLAITGVATVIVMAKFRDRHGHSDGAPFLVLSLNDMLQYSAFFGLAIYWRRKSQFHRRLLFLATCALTGPAFRRLIPNVSPDQWIYVGIDVLMLVGLAGDWIVNKRLHPVYLYGFPAALFGQWFAMYLDLSGSPVWLEIGHWLIR
jgi:hypothetical protein